MSQKTRVYALAVLLTLTTLCGCTTLPQSFRGMDPGRHIDATSTGALAGAQAAHRIDALELQSVVMSMADDYGSEIAEIVYLLLKPAAKTSQERVLAQSYVRNSFGAAAEIATGPNPEASLLDLLVLVSLQRATFERHWVPQVWGKQRGSAALERLRQLEARLWARSEFLLSVEQRATLRALIDAWLRENPGRFVVELVRFGEFSDARHLSGPEDRQAATGLLKEVGNAVAAIDDALLFGERAMWYAGRLTYILGQQTELTTYRILSDPKIEGALDGIADFNDKLQATLTATLDELVRNVRAERQRTIDHFFTTLEGERQQTIDHFFTTLEGERQQTIDHFFMRLQGERQQLLAALETESDSLRSRLIPELRDTITASTELVRLTGESATAIDRIVARFDKPSAREDQDGAGIAEIRTLLADASQTTDRLTKLLEHTNVLLQSAAWNERLGEVDTLSADIIDRVFWRAIMLIVLVFTGIFALRYVARR